MRGYRAKALPTGSSQEEAGPDAPHCFGWLHSNTPSPMDVTAEEAGQMRVPQCLLLLPSFVLPVLLPTPSLVGRGRLVPPSCFRHQSGVVSSVFFVFWKRLGDLEWSWALNKGAVSVWLELQLAAIVRVLKIISLFLAALGLHCRVQAFSRCGEWSLFSCRRVRASHCCGFSRSGARALGAWASVVAARGFSICDFWALGHRLSSCGSQA